MTEVDEAELASHGFVGQWTEGPPMVVARPSADPPTWA